MLKTNKNYSELNFEYMTDKTISSSSSNSVYQLNIVSQVVLIITNHTATNSNNSRDYPPVITSQSGLDELVHLSTLCLTLKKYRAL